jgi:hypothetical protein
MLFLSRSTPKKIVCVVSETVSRDWIYCLVFSSTVVDIHINQHGQEELKATQEKLRL